jgi:hypothetical protein
VIIRGNKVSFTLILPTLALVIEASIESTSLVTFSIAHAFTYLSSIDPLSFSFPVTALLFIGDVSCELDTSVCSGEPAEEYSCAYSEGRWQWL